VSSLRSTDGEMSDERVEQDESGSPETASKTMTRMSSKLFMIPPSRGIVFLRLSNLSNDRQSLDGSLQNMTIPTEV
jgi:hypothetical protein